MKFVCLVLIRFYQRFISPKKKFCCAYNTLYQTGSCSSAIEKLIRKKGLWKAWPDIRNRFKECSLAYHSLSTQRNHSPKADLPCDLSCNFDVGDCGFSGVGDTMSSDASLPCDIFSETSKKTRRRLLIGLILIALVGSYWFYGRDVSHIYLVDLGKQQSILKRFTQREHPEIRLLLTAGEKKYYSNIIQLSTTNTEYTFTFKKGPLGSIDSLKILDARVSVGGELMVLGQVLEEFKSPKKTAEGERFSYRIKRRWHLF